MTAVLGRAAVAPVLVAPNPRSEQVTQLLLGEVADVEGREADWLRLRLRRDGYEGWVHPGYLRECSRSDADRWHAEAWWSDGADVAVDSGVLRLDPGARAMPAGNGALLLPDGRRAEVVAGVVAARERVNDEARRDRPEEWALRHFSGAPYQWGGVTPRGVDCSGLVQIAFLLRGMALPRDARQQAECGHAVPPEQIAASDLLFFAEPDGRISHVAFAADGGGLIHATLACGGVLAEPWGPGTRAAALRDRLVAVRRIDE